MLTSLETAIIFAITYLVLVFASGAVLLNMEEKKGRRKKNGEKRRICKMHRRAKLQDDVTEKI